MMSRFYPHITVASVIEKDHRFLIVRENINGQIVYNQPAGHLEPNETLIDAAIRETREETTYDFFPTNLIGIYQWSSDTSTHFIRFTFTGNISEPEMQRKLDTPILDFHWLSLDELQSLKKQLRSPLIMRSIQDYINHQKYPISILTHV